MKLKSLLAICFVAIWACNCTGFNYVAMAYKGTNTNPTKEYANPMYVIASGGLLVHNGSIPGPIGHNAENGDTMGTACSKSILALIAFGDSSIEAAKTQSKITKVSHVEYEQFAILGSVYHSFCTVVYGSTTAISGAGDSKTDVKSAAGKKK
ncbi:TRL-like family protein [Leptospira sp. 201903070]|uniref:TRL-like family protein n=1 Tax=Leptospira ainlahdjerensis TaxID=2810033 RepID=A0ABS2U744_9LEPT|nr:TRL-like family protein [Leptospira ainlahdjerensis]MBM9575964.1 TRL-like family protein [Leptospira ainlahdjerensis]